MGTQSTKAGFGSEAVPRFTTESYLVESEAVKNDNFEEELFANNAVRQLAYNMDVSRGDYKVEDIYRREWQDSERGLGVKYCGVRK